LIAAIGALIVQTLGLSFTSVVSKAPELVSLMYANLIVPFVFCVYILMTMRRVRSRQHLDAGVA